MRVLITILYSLYGLGLCAQESTWALKKMQSQMEFEVKLASLTMRIGHEIAEDLKKQGITTERQLLATQEQEIAQLIQGKAMDYAQVFDNYWGQFDHDFKGKGLIKRYISQLEGKELASLIKSSMVGLGGFFKDKGIGVAIAVTLGMAMEYTSYLIISIVGMPQLIPFVMATPFGTIFSLVPGSANYFTMRKKLINELGGLQAYKAYKQQRKIALKKLNLKNTRQILFPLSNAIEDSPHHMKAAIIKKRNFWTFLKTKLGLNVQGLNYPNLKLFLLLNNVENNTIDMITEAGGLPYYIKTGLIAQVILAGDQRLKEKFLAKFSDYVVSIEKSGHHAAIRKWVEVLLRNPDLNTIRTQMADLPEGVHPKMAAELWEELIIPHYSTQFDITYTQFRKLKKSITVFKASVFQKGEILPSEFAALFDRLVLPALKAEIPRCTAPEKVVLRYLIGARP